VWGPGAPRGGGPLAPRAPEGPPPKAAERAPPPPPPRGAALAPPQLAAAPAVLHDLAHAGQAAFGRLHPAHSCRDGAGKGRANEENDPDGIRTRVAALKGLCPRPLDDGAKDISYVGLMSILSCRNPLA